MDFALSSGEHFLSRSVGLSVESLPLLGREGHLVVTFQKLTNMQLL